MDGFRVVPAVLLSLGLVIAAPAGTARAQADADKPSAETLKPRSPRTPPNLDVLFGALKVAPDEASAKAIEERIWRFWVVSPSDTANLLMTRVKTAIDGSDLDLALELLNASIEIAPNYVEAWNRRATVHYLKKDIAGAVSDLRHLLALEPRHFGALSGLGMIMQDLGYQKEALEAFRRALEVHPHLSRIPDLIKSLTEKVEGRDI